MTELKRIGKKSNVFVTGGAGFIGSHMVDRLYSLGANITVYDNLSTGFKENLSRYENDKRVNIVEADLLDFATLESCMKGMDVVFHFAANADLKLGALNTKRDLDQNTVGTYNVLEAMRRNGCKKIIFSSSSAVYGEPNVFPTPENYCATQNSLYGASKQASEGLVQAFCEMFGFEAWIYRFVSVMGERYSHGIVYDLFRKLSNNPLELEILGNGTQRKSFVYVGDLVNAVFLSFEKTSGKVNIFNIGNSEYIIITKAVKVIADEFGSPKAKLKYTGGKTGWKGDSPFVFLDISKLKKLGWEPKTSIEACLRISTRNLFKNTYLIDKHENGLP